MWESGILFLFEAPNWEDTFNEDKGYLTYDRKTDPSGRFARQLMVDELGLNPDFFQVTNSVLCLPAEKDGKFTISGAQRRLCAPLIQEQIRVLGPFVVVPVGSAALKATRQLERHQHRRMIDAVGRPIPCADTVFYHPDTLRKWTSDGVSIPWERARAAAGRRRLHIA